MSTTSSSSNHVPSTSSTHIHATLPSASTQREVSDARAAVVASMGNIVDRELHSRAAVLHDNTRALDKQERDVVAATDGLRREREKLAKEADNAARKLKEVGNVQNWAEVLERQFLVLEDTVRMANGEEEDDDDGGDGMSTGSSCSCSECGRGDVLMEEADGGDGVQHGGGEEHDAAADAAADAGGAWSDTSRSLHGPESSTGTGVAKGSETASMSTSS